MNSQDSVQVVRPQASLKKIHSRDEFELCYLRHQYIRRTTHNPTEAEMLPYHRIISNASRSTFFTYQGLFHLVGMDLEDVASIAKVQLVSYLGLFEITRSPVKYEAFLCKFQKKHTRDPEPEDILNKNKAIFTLFMKQRMQDLVRVCRQKAQNIKGMPTEEFYAYEGKKRLPPWVLGLLTRNNERYGYRKIDVATFKSVVKKAKPENDRFFRFENLWYIAIAIDHRALGLDDLAGADMDPRQNYHNLTPEQFLIETEDLREYENKISRFKELPELEKKVVFEAFINENKRNKNLREEVAIARKFLTKMGI